MQPENLDINSILEDRRKAVKESLKEIGVEDLRKMQIFPYQGHPREEMFSQFLEENAAGPFYHAMTHEGIHVIYSYGAGKGIWYQPGVSIGIIQPRGLAALKEIVEQK